jgi:N-acetylmuramoyl-L-alanine amidase
MLACVALPASADVPLVVLYQGQSIRLTHVLSTSGALAIGVNDPGLATILKGSGAWITWKPGERYILMTTPVPTVVSFAMGDRRYDVGPIALQAAFAPFQRNNEAYLPLDEVLSSLDVLLREDGGVKVLQPQLASIDVRQQNGRVILLAHGGVALRSHIVRQSASSVIYAFDGVGTTLSGTRQIAAGGVRSIQIQSAGTVREPTTLVTVALGPATAAAAPQQIAGRDIALTFGPSGGAPQSVAAGSPTPEPSLPGENGDEQSGPAGPAQVSGVSAQPSADGVAVTVAVAGNAAFEWHRLRDPDNRFWIDLKNAQLQGPAVDENAPSPLVSIRARQIDAATVRIALTLSGQKTITLTPSTTGLQIDVSNEDASDIARSGTGAVGSVVASGGESGAEVTPAPLDNSSGDTGNTGNAPWKFGPQSRYVPTNPRLIVIDPGHGGSDRGTIHGGVAEADLTLDMAKRLRDILEARGWQVKLTRETDVDVYAPNDSAHDELQARVDVANKAGARLFVSIHANAYINSGPYGTTTYISKSDDVAFAQIVERQLASDGTKDDGVVKSHLYVTLHARMPAVLVETAFLSNPSDYDLLTSPAWRQKVAQEMADGIKIYAQEFPVPDQPPQ